ncbi:MAG TPA: glycosyl hydrolase family 28-related protein [Longimicrobium sp.]|nr:glycosyl hydrolase family 28-related protein [Longimicrobium sp.]
MPEPDQIEGYILDRGGMVINVKHPRFLGGARGKAHIPNENVDDAPAINAALAEARKTGEYGSGVTGAIVYFPPGVYRVDTPLDCNLRQFNLLGAGSHQTVIRGNTGDRSAIIEMVAGGHSSIRGMLLETRDQPEPSSVGVLYGRDQFGRQSLMMSLEDVSIRLRSNPNANIVAEGGVIQESGTIGIYNVGVEGFSVHNCFVLADTACFFGTENSYGIEVSHDHDIPQLDPTKPLVPMTMMGAGASMTVVTFSGANWLTGMFGPSVRIDGGADFIIDAHLNNDSPQPENAYPYAIDVRAQVTNLEYRGSMETYQSVMRVASVVRGLRLHAYTHSMGVLWKHPNGATVPGPPRVYLDGGTLRDSTLQVVPTPGTIDEIDPNTQVEYGRGYLIRTSAAGGAVAGCQIFLRKHRIDMGSGSLRGNVILVETDLNDPGYGSLPRLAAASHGGNLIIAPDQVSTGW